MVANYRRMIDVREQLSEIPPRRASAHRAGDAHPSIGERMIKQEHGLS